MLPLKSIKILLKWISRIALLALARSSAPLRHGGAHCVDRGESWHQRQSRGAWRLFHGHSMSFVDTMILWYPMDIDTMYTLLVLYGLIMWYYTQFFEMLCESDILNLDSALGCKWYLNQMEASAVEVEEDLAHGLSDCHALHVARLQNAVRCLGNSKFSITMFAKPKYFWQSL